MRPQVADLDTAASFLKLYCPLMDVWPCLDVADECQLSWGCGFQLVSLCEESGAAVDVVCFIKNVIFPVRRQTRTVCLCPSRLMIPSWDPPHDPPHTCSPCCRRFNKAQLARMWRWRSAVAVRGGGRRNELLSLSTASTRGENLTVYGKTRGRNEKSIFETADWQSPLLF